MILSSIMLLKINDVLLLPRCVLKLQFNVLLKVIEIIVFCLLVYYIDKKEPWWTAVLTSIKSFDNCPVSNEFLTAKTSSWTDSLAVTCETFLSGFCNTDGCSDKGNSVSVKGVLSAASRFAAANFDLLWLFSMG